MKITYCTYCSAAKNQRKQKLPAIQLYKSKRIESVLQSAENDGIQFLILSGKYGLVEPDEEIDYYDHLLLPSEVDEHSILVASQLKLKKITKLLFLMNNPKFDNNLIAYRDCMKKACAKIGIPLIIKEVHLPD